MNENITVHFQMKTQELWAEPPRISNLDSVLTGFQF